MSSHEQNAHATQRNATLLPSFWFHSQKKDLLLTSKNILKVFMRCWVQFSYCFSLTSPSTRPPTHRSTNRTICFSIRVERQKRSEKQKRRNIETLHNLIYFEKRIQLVRSSKAFQRKCCHLTCLNFRLSLFRSVPILLFG